MKERALVMGTGIDYTEDDLIEITTQLLLPVEKGVTGEGGGNGEDAVWVAQSTGHTIFDAVRNYITKTGRRLFFQYNEILVISDEVAEDDMEIVLDFFERDHEIRLNQFILITEDNAADILEATHEQEQVPAEAIVDMVQGQNFLGKGGEVTLFDFTGDIQSNGTSPHAPKIIIEEEEDGEEILKIEGIAVFDHFDKLAGFLEPDQARGLNWVAGNLDTTVLVVNEEGDSEKIDGKHSIEVIQIDSSIDPEFENNSPEITVTVNIQGNVGEKQSKTEIPIEDQKKALERQSATVIENEIKSAFEKSQELNADIFGFGDALYNHYPHQWQEIEDEWPEIYPELTINIDVEANVRRTGVIRD